MSDVSEALNRVFKETSEFIVLGLTGRTGSGCSTAATILASPDANLPEVSNIYSSRLVKNSRTLSLTHGSRDFLR